MDQPSIIDPSALPHLKVEATEAAGVWHVRLPKWPWQYGRAEEEREALVRRIADRAPIRRLWLSDSTDDSHGQWLPLVTDQALADVGSGLDYGDWLLLFFERDPDPGALGLTPTYPKTPAAAVERLAAFGASAAIWSWLDDAEWLVAMALPASAPLLREALPAFADELRGLLASEGRADLAAQIDTLHIVDRCRCQDDFCATFYTRPKPALTSPPGAETIQVDAATGMVSLDLVHGQIASIEVLNRDDVRAALRQACP